MHKRSGKVRGRWGVGLYLLPSLVIGTAVLCTPAIAQEPVEPPEAPAPQEVPSQEDSAPAEPIPTAPPVEHPLKKNLLSLTLGGAYWPDLGNKTLGSPSSNSPKKLSSLGFALAGAYHRHIAPWEVGALYLGGEIGVFNFEGNNESTPSNQLITGELDGQLWYAGPSMKFMMGKGPVRFYLGGGGGYYEVSLSASDEVPRPPCTTIGPCWNTTRSLHRSTWGGFVSFGADIIAVTTQSGTQWRVRLEDQIHFVNFGSLESFAPGAGNLSGPINVLQIGVVLGFF